MASIQQLGTHIASAVVTLAVLIVATGGIAFVAARVIGGHSRRRRQFVFLIVSAVGVLGGAFFTQWKLGHPT